MCKIFMRAHHVLGKDNIVADALSRLEFTRVLEHDPTVIITPLQPLSISS